METVVLKDLTAVQTLALWMDFLHGKHLQPRVSGSSSRNVSHAKSSASRTTSVISPIRSVTKTGARGPRPTRRANHCIEYAVDNANLVHTDLLSSSSSSENRSRRLTNRPSLPSRAVMTTRAVASEIS